MVPDELLKYKDQPGFEYLDRFGNGTKRCSRCGEVKDYALFVKRSGRKSGLASQCRECEKERSRERRVRHRGRNAEKPKDPDYRKTCPQCGVTKSSVDFHRDRSSKDGLQCYCKDCAKQRNKASSRENPDRYKRSKETDRRKREITRTVATVSGRYSPEEDLVVLDNTLTTYQKAIKLSRALNSVFNRKTALKKKGITNVSNYPQV